jgi:hypothetical protein
LRGFYHYALNKKQSRTAYLLKNRALDRLLNFERKFVAATEGQPKSSPALIMRIVQASTFTNAQIKGHLKYGGGQIKKRHRR